MRKDIFGWFEGECLIHDPGLETICPVCAMKLELPVKCISLMKQGDSKSYFYRTHKHCYDNLTDREQNELDSSLIDNL